MVKIKEKDFVELDYTGKIKDDNSVFDTTNLDIAKENSLYNENAEYSPIVICVGQGQIIKGLENALVGKEPGDYTIEVKPEEAYGKKNAKLIQLISTAKFRKENVQPMPGLQVNIDGAVGIIKTVSGGRTLVDFNHPLAGKELIYDLKVKRIVDDDMEKINSVFRVNLGIKDADINVENKKATVTLKQDLPKELKEEIKKKIKEIVKNIEDITIQKEEKKQEDLNISNPTTKKGG
jgi:FKBP-type peptidyl-prolyl cis-trans isomerase 2